MKNAFTIVLFFLIFFGFVCNDLFSQSETAIYQSLPRFSKGTISTQPIPFYQSERSRLISLREQNLSQSTTADQGAQIVISTNIEDYEGLVNDTTFKGKTVRLKGFAQGNYELSMRQAGYHAFSTTLKIRDGIQYVLDVEMIVREGKIEIDADQPVQSVEIDGEGAGLPPYYVKEGRHMVRVRSFGWEDFRQTITVYEGTISRIAINFIPAPFLISGASASREIFRPANFGALGTTAISFEVSAHGSGKLTIKDASDRVVRTKIFERFDTWHQEFAWDGKDDSGNDLDEGSYRWQISGKSSTSLDSDPAASVAPPLQGTIRIDNSSYILFRSVWSGPPGLELVSDTYTLAQNAFQASAGFGVLANDDIAQPSSWSQLRMNVRYGFLQNFEAWVGASASFEFSGIPRNMVLFGGGATWAFLPLPGRSNATLDSSTDFGASLNLSGAGMVASKLDGIIHLDSTGLIPGLRLGVASQLRAGRFSILLEPVAHVLAWPLQNTIPVTASGPQALANPAPRFATSLRGGLYIDVESVLVGLSSALWITPEKGVEMPLRLALNLQFMPAESFVLGVNARVNVGDGGRLGATIGLTTGLLQ